MWLTFLDDQPHKRRLKFTVLKFLNAGIVTHQLDVQSKVPPALPPHLANTCAPCRSMEPNCNDNAKNGNQHLLSAKCVQQHRDITLGELMRCFKQALRCACPASNPWQPRS
jgi:hypothetical protein